MLRAKSFDLEGSLFSGGPAGAVAESPFDIIDDDLLEVGRDSRAAKRHGFLAVDKNRGRRLFAGAG